MAEYDPSRYRWKTQLVSELSLEEAQQALCALCEIMHAQSRSRINELKTRHRQVNTSNATPQA